MRSYVAYLLWIIVALPVIGRSQQVTDTIPENIPGKASRQYIAEVGSRSERLDGKIDQTTVKYLSSLQAQETAMQAKLAKIDPAAATRIFASSTQEYTKIQNDLRSNAQNVVKSCGKYVPGIDTALTSLKFLSQPGIVNCQFGGDASKVQAAMSKVKGLEDQFKKADNVEDFMRQRKDYLTQQLAGYPSLGGSMGKFKEESFYFHQQINEYKEAWNDPSKMEQKAGQLLNRLPQFRSFMKKNSVLAGLFTIPDDYATSGIPAGLQTRDQIQGLMQQAFTTMGPKGAQTASQNISAGQSMLSNLRTKFEQTGTGGEMPDFKPNNQKTKTFLKRLEYGFNMQSTKSNAYFPAFTDFAVTIGYKISDKNTAGVGMSYRVGWGQPIKHIHISNQGIGLRLFLDMAIKKGFAATSGFEYNYNQALTYPSLLQTTGVWQRSGLVGLSKEVPVKSGFLKKTKLQLLWDFLSYSQKPRTQPFKFRIGYNF